MTITEPVEPTIASAFGRSASHVKRRARQEWRLIPIGLKGRVARVLVVYLRKPSRIRAEPFNLGARYLCSQQDQKRISGDLKVIA